MHPDLLIGGIVVPVEARLGLRQSYAAVEAVSARRKRNGSLRTRVRWTGKLQTVISCEGWAPPGLSSLTRGADYLVKCAKPRAVSGVGAGNVITIPAARRADVAPYSVAFVNGESVATTMSVVGNVCTLDVVAGAALYQVWYWPEFTARLVEMSEEGNDDATMPFSATFEQT